MEALTFQDFKYILTNTEHSLLQQTVELLKTEQVNVAFDVGAIEEIA